jgi:hypothetical protein
MPTEASWDQKRFALETVGNFCRRKIQDILWSSKEHFASLFVQLFVTSHIRVGRQHAMVVIVAALQYLATPGLAKRLAPQPVTPVAKDGIEYSAPLSREGFVVAKWTKTGREIWSRQIYIIKHEYTLGLEEDVQTCFITALHFHNGKLRVTNEQGGEFEIDLESLTVTVLKGRAVIDYTDFKL